MEKTAITVIYLDEGKPPTASEIPIKEFLEALAGGTRHAKGHWITEVDMTQDPYHRYSVGGRMPQRINPPCVVGIGVRN